MSAESIFSQMWNAYRSIILRSLVTSFGLDFIVRDQTGGDVDTIHIIQQNDNEKLETVNNQEVSALKRKADKLLKNI